MYHCLCESICFVWFVNSLSHKERELSFLGILREIWDLYKLYLDVIIERCQFSLSKLSKLIVEFMHSFIVQCCCFELISMSND